jgi:hypothetical protein
MPFAGGGPLQQQGSPSDPPPPSWLPETGWNPDGGRIRSRFLSPGSARPYTQSEVFDFRRATLREALFSLEHLSPRLFEPEGYALHPEIEKVSGGVFRDGHFREAAFNAYVAVIGEVKAKTRLLDKKGKPMDGAPLMYRAFDCENANTPVVRFNSTTLRPRASGTSSRALCTCSSDWSGCVTRKRTRLGRSTTRAERTSTSASRACSCGYSTRRR